VSERLPLPGLGVTDDPSPENLQAKLDTLAEYVTGVRSAFIEAQRDPWHIVGATGGTQFASFWTTLAGANPVGFLKTPGGLVYLQGQAHTVGTVASNVIFTLPEGYRPFIDQYREITAKDEFGGASGWPLRIGTNGAVEIQSGNLVWSEVPLEGLFFYAGDNT
jgi:hypothetical protein